MIEGVHHTGISTPDMERAMLFYRDLLGFEVVSSGGWKKGTGVVDSVVGLRNSSARSAMLKCGDTIVELFEYESPAARQADPNRPVCDHGITHIGLRVDDIEAEYERLSAAGMRFHCPPQNLGSMKLTYGRDPDGNVIELLQLLG